MSIDAVGTAYQNQPNLPHTFPEKETKPYADPSEVSRLSAEIQQAEAEMKQTMKEVQKAAGESIGGASEKAQMLQSKLLMQQQEIMTKQLQIKEIESPKDAATEQAAAAIDARPKFDRYEAQQADADTSDNVYRLEERESDRKIIFHRAQ